MAPSTIWRRGLSAPAVVLSAAGLAAAQPGPDTPAGPIVPVRVQVQPPPTGTQPPPTGTQPPPAGGTQPPPAGLPSSGGAAQPALPSSAGAAGGGAGALPSSAAAAGAASRAGGEPTGGGGTGGQTDVRGASATSSAPAGAVSTSVSGAGGAAAAAQNATNSADLLQRSAASTGVEVQRRNSIVDDPRIRGLRSYQFANVGDGGLFQPARLDLDTPISRFPPGTVRDIRVVKGPYATVYGPGLAFLDLATLGSPRYPNGFEVHGRTAAGFQSNGNRWDLLQGVEVGDAAWGFRGTFNNQTGNDYRAGDGTRVPASFTSNSFNFAAGLNLTDKSSLELHGLSTVQNNVEFPGLYFDIRQSNTDAYSLRYTLDDQGVFDRLTLDVWYNSTASTGDTRSGNKQQFVQKLLGVSFNPVFGTGTAGTVPANVRAFGLAGSRSPTANEQTLLDRVGTPNLFRDDSTTRFAGRSLGYRLATSWGDNKDDPYLTIGTDLNAFGQGLVEDIQLRQLAGTSLGNGLPIGAGGQALLSQRQSIPESNQVIPGIFLQARTPLTSRWTVRSGGRVDWAMSSSNPRQVTGNFNLFGPPALTGTGAQGVLVPGVAATGPQNLDPIVYSSNPSDPELTRRDLLLAGFLSSEYKLGDHWTSTLSLGHAQRVPTLTELYAAGPFVGVLQQGTSRLIGDPNLKSEHLTQLDFGLRAEYDYLQFGGNAFYGWVDNYVTFDANRLSPGLTQVVFTNTDRATLAGAELFAQADLTDWLTPFGTLSYVQGVDQTATDNRRAANLGSSRRDDPLTLSRKTATEPLPQIAPLQSRVGFRLHQPGKAPRWQVEFSTFMMSGQTLVASSLGELPTPGFTVFNIRGFVKVTDTFLVSAGVDNLGDRTYRQHLDPISGNILGSGALLRPGANFFLNTQLSY